MRDYKSKYCSKRPMLGGATWVFYRGFPTAWTAVNTSADYHKFSIPLLFETTEEALQATFSKIPGLWQKHCQDMVYMPKDLIFGNCHNACKDDSWPMFVGCVKELYMMVQLTWKYYTDTEVSARVRALRRLGYQRL